MSYANFEVTTEEEDIDAISAARRIFERGNDTLRRAGTPEERDGILQAWYKFEEENGDNESKNKIKNMLPRKIKKRVPYASESGVRNIKFFFFYSMLLIYLIFQCNHFLICMYL